MIDSCLKTPKQALNASKLMNPSLGQPVSSRLAAAEQRCVDEAGKAGGVAAIHFWMSTVSLEADFFKLEFTVYPPKNGNIFLHHFWR